MRGRAIKRSTLAYNFRVKVHTSVSSLACCCVYSSLPMAMSLVEIRAPPQKCPKNPKMHPPPSFDLTLYSVGFRPRAARIHLELRFPKEPAFPELPLPFSQPSRRTFHRARWHLAGNLPSWKLLLHPLISSPGRRRHPALTSRSPTGTLRRSSSSPQTTPSPASPMSMPPTSSRSTAIPLDHLAIRDSTSVSLYSLRQPCAIGGCGPRSPP